MKRRRYILFISQSLLFLSCLNKPKPIGWDEFETYHNRFVVKSYDSNKTLRHLKSFDLKDSSSYGEDIYFDEQGKYEKWYWYERHQRYPDAAIYYFNIGSKNDSVIGGHPILKVLKSSKSNLLIEMINPKNVNSVLEVRELKNKKLINTKAYYPGKTDTTSWVTLKNFSILKNHEYYLYYFLLDKKKQIIDSFSTEIIF